MLATMIVGLIFATILFFAAKKTYMTMKYKQCNCGTNCPSKSKCTAAKK